MKRVFLIAISVLYSNFVSAAKDTGDATPADGAIVGVAFLSPVQYPPMA